MAADAARAADTRLRGALPRKSCEWRGARTHGYAAAEDVSCEPQGPPRVAVLRELRATAAAAAGAPLLEGAACRNATSVDAQVCNG